MNKYEGKVIPCREGRGGKTQKVGGEEQVVGCSQDVGSCGEMAEVVGESGRNCH